MALTQWIQQRGKQRASTARDGAHRMPDQRPQSGRGGGVAEPLPVPLRGHDRAEIHRQRVMDSTQRFEDFAEAQARDEQIGRHADALRQRRVCLVEPILLAIQNAEIGQRGRIVRVCTERAPEQAQRFVDTVAIVCADGEEVERIRIVRHVAQQLGECTLCLKRVALIDECARRDAARGEIRSGIGGGFIHRERTRPSVKRTC
jgi:hypothetical protein